MIRITSYLLIMIVAIASMCTTLAYSGYVRKDKQIIYFVVYRSVAYNNLVANDRSVVYVQIPGSEDGDVLVMSYEISPLMYPVSQGLEYNWRILNKEWHHYFKKKRNNAANREF